MKEEKRETIEDVSENHAQGTLREFWSFLMHNKKFWLLPMVLVFLILGALIIMGGSSAAPFVYTLF